MHRVTMYWHCGATRTRPQGHGRRNYADWGQRTEIASNERGRGRGIWSRQRARGRKEADMWRRRRYCSRGAGDTGSDYAIWSRAACCGMWDVQGELSVVGGSRLFRRIAEAAGRREAGVPASACSSAVFPAHPTCTAHCWFGPGACAYSRHGDAKTQHHSASHTTLRTSPHLTPPHRHCPRPGRSRICLT